MSIIRLILFFLISSTLFSNSIEYRIDGNRIKLINNHFVIDNSNAVITKHNLVFDIYRLEFIIDKKDKIKFEVNNVEWVNTNYQASGMNFDDLINIHELFDYKSCPTVYVDIFPYKKDEDDNLLYIKSIDISFYIDDIVIESFCEISDKMLVIVKLMTACQIKKLIKNIKNVSNGWIDGNNF